MKYQILSPLKTADGIVSEGYVEIADADVEALQAAGVLGDAEPKTDVKAKADAKK